MRLATCLIFGFLMLCASHSYSCDFTSESCGTNPQMEYRCETAINLSCLWDSMFGGEEISSQVVGKWVTGDYNGDGKDDIANVYGQNGLTQINFYGSLGYIFSFQAWASNQGGYWDKQRWLSGDFNGDGKDDLAVIFNDSGMASVDVYISTGSTFTRGRWATRQGGYWDDQQWKSGDFNGDGKDDLAKVYNDNGQASIDVHPSSGSSFSIQQWATRQGGFSNSQRWVMEDFNGDGKADLANVFNDNGLASIDVHPSSGSSFSIQRWATRQGGFYNSQKWVAGDFNGDGKADLAKIFAENHAASIDVHPSNGTSFGIERWATSQGGFWDTQVWGVGDFNGDGKQDLTKVFAYDFVHAIDVHQSNGYIFPSFSRWHNMSL